MGLAEFTRHRPGVVKGGNTMTTAEEKQAIIVTFHRKDRRRDQSSDKVELARRMVEDADHILDVDLYEAPILILNATRQEIGRLRNDANVAAVEEDGLCTAQGDGPTGEVTPDAETIPAGVSQIGAPQAWDASRGKGIKVAILDTGIDALHPDLAPNVKGAVSFVPGEAPTDGNGHGTHAAGIIAAAENGVGIIGVAPAAWLYNVKVLDRNGSGQFSWIIAGIDWCISNKMDIISIQFGGFSVPAALESLCNAAWANGLLVIATAGVGGPGMGTVAAPAKFKNVIAVSAVDSTDVITPFSGRGPEVELCAPGINVLSTKPGGGYQSWSGTAGACAHVSGAAAVAWGSHRFATNVEIWNLLAGTARPLGNPGWDPLYGYGRVQADDAALTRSPQPTAALKP
jgi:subtilisin